MVSLSWDAILRALPIFLRGTEEYSRSYRKNTRQKPLSSAVASYFHSWLVLSASLVPASSEILERQRSATPTLCAKETDAMWWEDTGNTAGSKVPEESTVSQWVTRRRFTESRWVRSGRVFQTEEALERVGTTWNSMSIWETINYGEVLSVKSWVKYQISRTGGQIFNTENHCSSFLLSFFF